MQDKMINEVPIGDGSPYANNPKRSTQASIEINITFLIPNLLRKKGIARMNNVSDIWEIDNMMVDRFTTNESAYSGTFTKPERKESPYILVNCKAAPNIMEKIKNNAILYAPNKVKAFKPNCSMIPASFEIDLGGGHFGNVKE